MIHDIRSWFILRKHWLWHITIGNFSGKASVSHNHCVLCRVVSEDNWLYYIVAAYMFLEYGILYGK